MPYKAEKIKLPKAYDRRRKLSDADKDQIREMYAAGLGSLKTLADLFGVSKKTILLIVNPESKKKNDEYIKEHWKEFQRSKEERNEAAKKTRRYKQKLYKTGLLKAEEEAKWIYRDGKWICSHCKGNAIETTEGNIAITMHCPHCGHKMSMEEQENG